MSKKRKIIQISCTPESENYPPGVFALCDDGSLWKLFYSSINASNYWEKVKPDIPQPGDDK